MNPIKIRNKNAILELLEDGVGFEGIYLVENMRKDALTRRIVRLAEEDDIPVRSVRSSRMIKRKGGSGRETIYGSMVPQNFWALDSLIDHLYDNNRKPFFLLMDRVDFPRNIGAIARTAFAVGVNGLVFQGKKTEFINEQSMGTSRGAIARLPLVKTSIFHAIKELKKNGVKVFSLEMEGGNYWKQDLTGPLALVLGDESEGLSNTISERCDGALRIPMKKGMDSLNVSVSASIVMYEKLRQDRG